MSQVNDARRDWFSPRSERAWLNDEFGIPYSDVNGMWYQFFEMQGIEGAYNDKWISYALSLGASGSKSDMMLELFKDGLFNENYSDTANLNGSDQYWDLSEDVVVPENSDFVFEITLKAIDPNYYIYGSNTINNDYRLAFIAGVTPKAYGLRFNEVALNDPRDTQEHVLKVQRVGTNIKIFVNNVEQASETVTPVALLINRLGGKFDGTTSVNNLNGYVKKFKVWIDGVLTHSIQLTNKNQGKFQLANVPSIGENLYTPDIITNPANAQDQWSYLGDGRWYLDGDGSLNALQFILTANQPISGYLQFEIESISGGTLGCTADSINEATFNSVGVKTYYYEDLTTQGNSIQFKRRGGSTKVVIKNIKHYDAAGGLIATMVGYTDSVWGSNVAPQNLAQPAARGSGTPSEEVETDDGSWESDDPVTYTYQWQLDGVDIPSATSASVLVLIGWVGSVLRCAVTAANSFGSTVAYSTEITVTL